MTHDADRTRTILDALEQAFSGLAESDPVPIRRKYRKMAADPFAFYRGSAPLFYADMAGDWSDRDARWIDDRTGRIWIQGDLHAENYGTYMAGNGVLVFDVNDFDEAYLGHFTWDLQRMAASVALLGWGKALPDEAISRLVESYVRAYVDQVHQYVGSNREHDWALRLDTATGAVREALLEAQLATRIGLLDEVTVVEDYRRRFRDAPTVRRLPDEEREAVEHAYRAYLDTVPGADRLGSLTYDLKDVVGKTGFGIGSAGLPSYNLLVEGHTQALENDVVLTMKQGLVASASRVVDDEAARECFEHEGHRTAMSQRALQAHADPWLGWARMQGGAHDGIGFVVQEFSPYEADLDWSALSEPDELDEVLQQLGRATAKVHCVSDADDESTPLVGFQTEQAVVDVLEGAQEDLVHDVVSFAHDYARRARGDHELFVEAFREGAFTGLAAT